MNVPDGVVGDGVVVVKGSVVLHRFDGMRLLLQKYVKVFSKEYSFYQKESLHI